MLALLWEILNVTHTDIKFATVTIKTIGKRFYRTRVSLKLKPTSFESILKKKMI
jgi:hypothetical protein